MITKVFKENDDFIIKKSRNGSGIFTKRPFDRDEKLFEVTGKFVTGDEDDVMDEETRSNTYRYSEDFYISPQGTIGDFLNHSCNPNARIIKKGKKLLLSALKSIPKDTEVLMDYSTIIAADDSWIMKCNCGDKRCRGTIAGFAELPTETKEEYIQRSIVPHYILEI